MRNSIKVILVLFLVIFSFSLIYAKKNLEVDSSDATISNLADDEDGLEINETEDEEETEEENETEIENESDSGKRVTKEEQTYTFLNNEGEEVRVNVRVETKEKNGEIYQKIKVRNYEADSELEIEEEVEGNRTKIKALLSNGSRKEVKVMPDRASKRAIEVLQSKNISIILKEVGEGNNLSVVYEAEGNKTVKFLGLFKVRAQLTAVVNAENGEIMELDKPWWYFLAFGKGTIDCDIENMDLCNETECDEISGYWYNESCNLEDYVEEPLNQTGSDNSTIEIPANSTQNETLNVSN